MPFRPLYDHILVRAKDPEKKYGSILIPDSAQEKMQEGTVVAVGRGICNHINGRWTEPSVKTGDRVLFGSKYAGTEVKLDGETLVVMREDDLAAVIDP
jgi:chaperonin GroES